MGKWVYCITVEIPCSLWGLVNLNSLTFNYFINFQCKYTFELMMLKTRGVFLWWIENVTTKETNINKRERKWFLKAWFWYNRLNRLAPARFPIFCIPAQKLKKHKNWNSRLMNLIIQAFNWSSTWIHLECVFPICKSGYRILVKKHKIRVWIQEWKFGFRQRNAPLDWL